MSAKVTVDGQVFEIPEKMTYGELFDVEQKIGANAGPISAMLGAIWIAVRRVKPETTFEDLRDLEFDESHLRQEDDASPPAVGPEDGAKPDATTTASAPGSEAAA